jgi:hypothetical protein
MSLDARIVRHLSFGRNSSSRKTLPLNWTNCSPGSQDFGPGGEQFSVVTARPYVAIPVAGGGFVNSQSVAGGDFLATQFTGPAINGKLESPWDGYS